MHPGLERREIEMIPPRNDHESFRQARERFFATIEAQSALYNIEAAWSASSHWGEHDKGASPCA